MAIFKLHFLSVFTTLHANVAVLRCVFYKFTAPGQRSRGAHVARPRDNEKQSYLTVKFLANKITGKWYIFKTKFCFKTRRFNKTFDRFFGFFNIFIDLFDFLSF